MADPADSGNVRPAQQGTTDQINQRAAQSAADAQVTVAQTNYNYAKTEYQNNPTAGNLVAFSLAQAQLSAAQFAAGGSTSSGESRDVDRKTVSSTGQGDTPASAPESAQTEETTSGTSSAPQADQYAANFIYSDINMQYILDKRLIPMRTADNLLHIFFMETYKSIESWYNVTKDSLDGTRFDGMTISVSRKAGGDVSKEEFSYTVSLPPEFADKDEDNIVDSILWAYTSYKEGVTALTSATDYATVPIISNGGGFLFPVFIVDPTKDTISPLTNIKYPMLHYNPVVNFFDLTFWSNYRIKADGVAQSHPFTRDRDLRNVGRAAMFTTGWYDRAKITYKGQSYYRNIFMFAPPQQIITPGAGGEFDVDHIEPVVDSVPMGLKFVEFSS